jgi:P pilus assembly chaperone PapD
MMSKVMTALAAALFLSLVCAGAALAGTCSIEVSPLTVEARVEPERAYTGSIELKNMGDETQHIKAYCQDWTLKPDGLVVFVDAGKLPNSASRWMALSPAEFDLNAGESARVRYTVRPPAGSAGEYRTVIIFEAGAQQMTLHGSQSRVVPRVGTILYVQTGAASAPQAGIAQFAANPDGGLLVVENAGNSHLRFTGRLEVRKAGDLIQTTDLMGFVVLPAPFNQHHVKLAKEAFAGLAPGEYELTAILDCGGPSLLGARTSLTMQPNSTTASAR